MSSAEIADNKWEVSATRPPVGLSGAAQLMLFFGFCLLFGWIAAMSIVAVTTPRHDNSLEDQYRRMNKTVPKE